MLRAPPSPGFAAGDIAIAAPRSGPSFQARGVIILQLHESAHFQDWLTVWIEEE
jgi:hypothetical protein